VSSPSRDARVRNGKPEIVNPSCPREPPREAEILTGCGRFHQPRLSNPGLTILTISLLIVGLERSPRGEDREREREREREQMIILITVRVIEPARKPESPSFSGSEQISVRDEESLVHSRVIREHLSSSCKRSLSL